MGTNCYLGPAHCIDSLHVVLEVLAVAPVSTLGLDEVGMNHLMLAVQTLQDTVMAMSTTKERQIVGGYQQPFHSVSSGSLL